MYSRRGRGNSLVPVTPLTLIYEQPAGTGIAWAVGALRLGLSTRKRYGSAFLLDHVDAYLTRNGAGPASISLKMLNDNTGLPGGVKYTSAAYSGSALSPVPAWFTFQFKRELVVADEALWAAVMTTAIDGTNFASWNSPGALTAIYQTVDGSTWTLANASQAVGYRVYGYYV